MWRWQHKKCMCVFMSMFVSVWCYINRHSHTHTHTHTHIYIDIFKGISTELTLSQGRSWTCFCMITRHYQMCYISFYDIVFFFFQLRMYHTKWSCQWKLREVCIKSVIYTSLWMECMLTCQTPTPTHHTWQMESPMVIIKCPVIIH